MYVSAEATEDLHRFLQDWCRRNIKAVSVQEAEQLAEETRRTCGEVVFEQAILQTAEQDSYRGPRVPCSCGSGARFVSYRHRWVKSVYGEVRVRRAYYHCGVCRHAVVPWDQENGLSSLVWTPRTKALVVQAAARLTYSEAVAVLEEMGVLKIEESCAERIMREVGQRLREAEASQMAGCEAGSAPPAAKRSDGERLYVAMDAAKAHIDGNWHDVKTGMVYTVQPNAEGVDQMNDRHYVAAQEPAERFGWRLYAAAGRWGEPHYKDVVFLGDGADYNWKTAAFHFPRATPVLDFMHACQHVWSLSRAFYGEQSPQGKRWAEDRIRSLKREGPSPLLRALKRRKPPTREAEEVLRRESAYFASNRDRMHYHKYRARGLMIGSGPVEAACKVVVGQRMKQSGMRWVATGADVVLAARTAVLNREFDHIRTMSHATHSGTYCYLH